MRAAMHTFKDVALRRVIRTLLERAGSETAEASRVSDHLVDANLRGHDSHGIGLVPFYVENIARRTMFPNTGLSLVRDGGAVMQFDGGFGFGQRVGAELMERLIERGPGSSERWSRRFATCITSAASAPMPRWRWPPVSSPSTS